MGIVRRFIRLLLGLLVVVMPLPLGGNREWIMLSALVLVLAACVIVLLANAPRAEVRRWNMPLVVLCMLCVGWFLYLALQIVGGHALLASMDPAAGDAANRLIAIVEAFPGFMPLSIEPSATLLELAHGLLGFAVFFLAVYAVRIPAHVIFLLGFVVAAAFIQAVIGAYEFASGADLPTMRSLGDRGINGTFINRNHFAGFLAIAAAIAAGVLADELSTHRRHAIGASRNLVLRILDLFAGRNLGLIVICVALLSVIGISGSRGAYLGFGFAVLAGLLIIGLGGRQPGRTSTTKRSYGLLLVALGGAVAFSLADSTVLERSGRLLENGLEDGRLAEWRISAQTIAARPLTGYGAGTFADAYALHRDGSLGRNNTFDHAHNQYLEMLVETGALGSALLGGFVLVVLWTILRVHLRSASAATRRAALASLLALLAVLVHAMVEFNFEIPAIHMTFFIMAGAGVALAVHRTRKTRHPGQPPHETEAR